MDPMLSVFFGALVGGLTLSTALLFLSGNR